MAYFGNIKYKTTREKIIWVYKCKKIFSLSFMKYSANYSYIYCFKFYVFFFLNNFEMVHNETNNISSYTTMRYSCRYYST